VSTSSNMKRKWCLQSALKIFVYGLNYAV
jgi:hypothetical protein